MPKILMPYTVHLDHTLRVTPVSTLFYKGDSNAHRFELNVLSKGLQADLSGCTAVYRFYRLQDSTVVSNPASIESGKVVAVLDKACYDYIGRFALTISIQNGEEETTVFYGDGYMSGNRADTGITGDYVVYDVETLLAKIAEIDTAIANANTAIANANTATENANAAEAARADAEAERVAAEEYRVGHESTRQMHENDRVAHEKTRISSETTRRNAETERAAAETARSDAETARAEAEQQRAAAEEARGAAETDRESAEQARAAAEQARQETFAGYEERIVAATPDDTTVNGRAWTSKKTVDSLCMPLEAAGNPVQVYPVEGYPLGVKVSWEPTQAGSGDPSPDNIRPISGRDAVKVTRCGKNLVDSPHNVKVSTLANGSHAYYVSISGITDVLIQWKFTGTAANTAGCILVYYNDGSKEVLVYWGTNIGSKKITKPAKAISIEDWNGANGDMVLEYLQAELGSTATPYEPYTGSTTDIALPETVYGGTLDVEMGVVTVVTAYETLTSTSPTGKAFYKEGSSFRAQMADSMVEHTIVSTHYTSSWKTTEATYRINNVNHNDETGVNVYIVDPRFTTETELKAWLDEQNAAGTPVQICYKLARPYTIQLTQQQIAALSGVNTIYTDAGTLTVTGREDPRHTIVTLTDRIAALESAAAGV